MKTVQERVIDALKQQTGKAEIALTDTFRGDLNFDSMDAVESVLMLEEEFGFELDDDAVARYVNVGQLVDYMEGRDNG